MSSDLAFPSVPQAFEAKEDGTLPGESSSQASATFQNEASPDPEDCPYYGPGCPKMNNWKESAKHRKMRQERNKKRAIRRANKKAKMVMEERLKAQEKAKQKENEPYVFTNPFKGFNPIPVPLSKPRYTIPPGGLNGYVKLSTWQ